MAGRVWAWADPMMTMAVRGGAGRPYAHPPPPHRGYRLLPRGDEAAVEEEAPRRWVSIATTPAMRGAGTLLDRKGVEVDFDARYLRVNALLKGLLFVWWLLSLAYVTTLLAVDLKGTMAFLTYWSLIFETVILTVTIFVFMIPLGARCWRRSNVVWRIPVIFGGWYLATSTMVLVGSVYISSAGFTHVGNVIRTNPAMGVGNYIIHTLPWVMAMVFVSAYQAETIEHLSRAKILLFFLPGEVEDLAPDGDDNTGCAPPPRQQQRDLARYKVIRALMDFAYFWVPVLPPVAWMSVSVAEDTYHLPPLPPSFYILITVSLVTPLIVLVVWARTRRMFMHYSGSNDDAGVLPTAARALRPPR